MKIFDWIKEKFKMLFKTDAEKTFGVETYLSPEMDAAIKLWGQLESGKPPWETKKIQTRRFSKTIAEELTKLITQSIDVKVQGAADRTSGTMPEQMQKIIDKYFLKNAKDIIYDMVSFGGVMAKWDGEGIEFLRPDMFLVTEYDSSKEIHAAIFFSYYQKDKKFYTKAEWHRFEESVEQDEAGETVSVREYRVSTKAFRSDKQDDIGREIPLSETKWKDLKPEFWADELEKPLFRYIKCPVSNNIDHSSPLGVPCFSDCLRELEDLDTAMSMLKIETRNSAPMMIVDQSVIQYASMNGIELPEFVANVGNLDTESGGGSPVEQWQPQLQISSRKEGINFYLSVIGFKCGFDPGFFVFDGQDVVMATATQVESTQKRVVDTVSSYREVLDRPKSNGDGRVGAIHDIAYIINAMLIINGKAADGTLIPFTENGNYELFCDFADLTDNKEENKLFDYQLAQNGYMSKMRFLVRHLGLTEEEARQMVREAVEESQANKPDERLFGEE